jgi:uncharacterized protein (DUF2235 family)
MSLLKKDDPTKQLVYYQTGIGTYSEADVRIPAIRKISQAVDLMFATTLGHHIRDGESHHRARCVTRLMLSII